jgi:TRAP-type C4-dicarboxylate transport system substrate-binding protein
MTEHSGTGRLARALAACLAVALGALGHDSRAEEVTLRLHHFLPPQAIAQTKFLEPWAKKVKADSGGRIRIDIFPAMQLGGKPSQLFDQVRDGVVDLVWTVPGYTPGRFPRLEVFELPFVGASAEATSQAVMEYSLKHLDATFAGVKPLVFHTHAPGALHTSGYPIERLEDLVGVKLRTPNRTITRTLEQLGAIPVGMPAMQVPQAIARGVVDGTVFPWEVTLPLRIHEITDSHTNVFTDRGLYTVVIVLAMNQGRYDRLPDDLKAVIDANSGMAIAAEVGRVWDEAELPGQAAAEARGNRFIDLDSGEVERWKRTSEPVIEDWVERMGEEGPALLAEARALVAKYAGN